MPGRTIAFHHLRCGAPVTTRMSRCPCCGESLDSTARERSPLPYVGAVHEREDMEVARVVPTNLGEAVLYTSRALSKVDDVVAINEDAVAVWDAPDALLLAAADGIRGWHAGPLTIHALCEGIRPDREGARVARATTPEGRALDALHVLHHERLAADPDSLADSESTFAALVIRHGELVPLTVGDCAFAHLGRTGQVKAAHLPRRRSRAHVGTGRLRVERFAPSRLARGDRVLVATPGIFRCFESGDLVKRMTRRPLEEIAAALLDGRTRSHSGATRAAARARLHDDAGFVLFRPW